MSYFRNLNNDKPRPDADFVEDVLFPNLSKGMLRSAEALFMCMITEVEEVKERRRLDYDTKWWIFSNYRVAIMNQFNSMIKIATTHPEVFDQTVHLSACESVLAMFMWIVDVNDKFQLNALKRIVRLVDKSELGETRIPIEWQKFYRMYHYLIDVFDYDILRYKQDPNASEDLLKSIYSFLNKTPDIGNERNEQRWISQAFRDNNQEWKYNFIHTVYERFIELSD